MDTETHDKEHWQQESSFDFGLFEGFSFGRQCALPNLFTAEDIVNHDHDGYWGECEWWPHGDSDLLRLITPNKITGCEIKALDSRFYNMREDEWKMFCISVHVQGYNNTLEDIIEHNPDEYFYMIATGSASDNLYEQLGQEIMEAYHYEAWQEWEEKISRLPGMSHDYDWLRDDYNWSTSELQIDGEYWLVAW